MKSAKTCDEIVIDARTMRSGKKLAFLECEIKNKTTGEVLVKGNQSIFYIRNDGRKP